MATSEVNSERPPGHGKVSRQIAEPQANLQTVGRSDKLTLQFAPSRPLTFSAILHTSLARLAFTDLCQTPIPTNRSLPMCEILASGNFYAHGRISPPIRGVALHIPQTRTPKRAKRKRGRWGVCKAPTGASPRKPPNRSFFAHCIFQSATILGKFLKTL